MESILRAAIDHAGGPKIVGPACGVSYQAALKWYRKGRLPRTEWTGETKYATVLEQLTDGKYKAREILQMDAA